MENKSGKETTCQTITHYRPWSELHVNRKFWLDEFWKLDEEGRMALLLGKGVGICNRMMEDVGECVLYWLGR